MKTIVILHNHMYIFNKFFDVHIFKKLLNCTSKAVLITWIGQDHGHPRKKDLKNQD